MTTATATRPRRRKQPARKCTVSRAQSVSAIAQRKDVFLSLYEDNLCNMTATCKQMGISRSTPYDWAQADPVFKKTLDETQETQIDFVEGALMKNARGGNVTAQIFYLKCRAKHRGYVERQEITGADGAKLDLVQECPMSEEEILAAVETVRMTLTQSREMGQP